MEAWDRFKQKGYAQKLKTDITPDFMNSGHQDFITLLYGQVACIDGRCFIVYSCAIYEQFMAQEILPGTKRQNMMEVQWLTLTVCVLSTHVLHLIQ